jgi:nitrogenase iron protein NifH
VRLGGLICNSRKVDNEEEMIKAFAERLGTHMLYFLSRDNMVQRAEINRKTVIEHDASCPMAQHYRNLAKRLDENEMFVIPKPMHTDDLERVLLDYGLLDVA